MLATCMELCQNHFPASANDWLWTVNLSATCWQWVFFPQYDAVGSCAGTCVHVVHSNCACTRRSVNSVRHSTCYHKLWGSGQSEEYLRFKCCLHCLYQERIGNTTQDKNTVATYNITYSFSARRGWTFEWRATVNWDNVTSDNEYSDSTDTTTTLEIYFGYSSLSRREELEKWERT